MSQLNHNVSDHPENTGFDPIPAGEYKAVIVASDLKPTKNGQDLINRGANFSDPSVDKLLKLKLQIIEGQYENSKLWANLNIQNKSEEATRIAKGELSSICKAVGKPVIKMSEELHNIPLIIKVVIKPAQNGYPEQNEIKGYKAVNAQVAAPALSQAAPTATGSAPPWKKR